MIQSILKELKQTADDLSENWEMYQFVLHDPQTPPLARLLLRTAIGYIELPFDFIPDFIPFIGKLDDAVIIPGLVRLALALVPENVFEEAQRNFKFQTARKKAVSLTVSPVSKKRPAKRKKTTSPKHSRRIAKKAVHKKVRSKSSGR